MIFMAYYNEIKEYAPVFKAILRFLMTIRFFMYISFAILILCLLLLKFFNTHLVVISFLAL